MTPELLTAILGAGGVAAILPKLVDGIKAWRSGRAVEEKNKNRGLVDRLAAAESRAEFEAMWRRDLQEYSAGLRRVLIEDHGVEPDRLPSWPARRRP